MNPLRPSILLSVLMMLAQIGDALASSTGGNMLNEEEMSSSRSLRAQRWKNDGYARKKTDEGAEIRTAVLSSDSNTALGRRQAFNHRDFVFDLAGSTPDSETPAGTIQPLGVAQLPALAGEGVSYSLFNIQPCGINLPHVHQRATELLFVISGQKLRTAFTEENGGRVIVNDISEGMATFFPQGLLHYQQNLSCEPATYLSALNHEDPGVLTVTTQFFRLPQEAIEGSIGEDSNVVQQLIDGLPLGPAEGRKQCLMDCGLWGNDGFNE